MALVLSLKNNEIVYIDGTPYSICNLKGNHFHIENKVTKKRYKVVPTKMVEIYPQVKVSAGPSNRYNTVKLVVEAPKKIRLIRAEKGMRIRTKIINKAKDLGILDRDQLDSMIKLSAPTTHEKGNRRYDNYIFLIKEGEIEDVNLFDDTKDTTCPDCNGDGYFCLTCGA